MMVLKPGRRPGPSLTRDSILDAARHLFGERGFDATTIRDIAALADVDPAMVHHHFGSKDKLFTAALGAPIDPREHIEAVLTGPDDSMGERLLETMLAIWDSPIGIAGVALLRTSIQHEWGAKLLREFVLMRALTPIMQHLGLPEEEARWRTGLLATQISGVILMRFVIKLDPIATASRADLVAAMAPNVQRYLTGLLPVREF